jgi:hypothetical protein
VIPAAKPLLHTLAILAGAMQCPPPAVPAVQVQFINNPPTFSYDKTTRELGEIDSDTVFSQGPREVFITGGLTQSRISTEFSAGYKSLMHPKTRETCVWIDNINVKIVYSPLVHIASDYPAGSCMNRETTQHELRHVNVDIITINEHLPRLKAAVQNVSYDIGTQGPYAEADIDKARDLYMNVVRTALKTSAVEMNDIRMKRQQQIDTRQEYLRLSKVCPK